MSIIDHPERIQINGLYYTIEYSSDNPTLRKEKFLVWFDTIKEQIEKNDISGYEFEILYERCVR